MSYLILTLICFIQIVFGQIVKIKIFRLNYDTKFMFQHGIILSDVLIASLSKVIIALLQIASDLNSQYRYVNKKLSHVASKLSMKIHICRYLNIVYIYCYSYIIYRNNNTILFSSVLYCDDYKIIKLLQIFFK